MRVRQVKHYSLDDDAKALIKVLVDDFETRVLAPDDEKLHRIVNRIKESLR